MIFDSLFSGHWSEIKINLSQKSDENRRKITNAWLFIFVERKTLLKSFSLNFLPAIIFQLSFL